MRAQKEIKDIPRLPKAPTIQEMRELCDKLVDGFNYLNKNISLAANFNGQIIENIAFTAGETKTIPHSLGIKPKHRIVLNLEGNGVISDIPSGWNNFSIQLKNNGAVAITATVMLVRE